MTSDRTVFVVTMNDDRAVRDSIKALLDSIGHSVRVCDSAEDFISLYKPDLQGCLILDMCLSDRSALQFID